MNSRQWSWRLIAALLIVVVIVSSLVVGSAPPESTPRRPVNTTGDARLEFLPVIKVSTGRCHRASPRRVSSDIGASCLTVTHGLIVTQPATAAVVPDPAGYFDVQVFLTGADETTYIAMTARLSKQPYPRNWLAIVIGDPPDGELLGAPAVTGRIDGPIDLPGGTRTQAYQSSTESPDNQPTNAGNAEMRHRSLPREYSLRSDRSLANDHEHGSASCLQRILQRAAQPEQFLCCARQCHLVRQPPGRSGAVEDRQRRQRQPLAWADQLPVTGVADMRAVPITVICELDRICARSAHIIEKTQMQSAQRI
nr:hypothetical protein [Microlunatus endophyticus]